MDKEQINTQSNGDTGEFYIEIMILYNNFLSLKHHYLIILKYYYLITI